MIIDISFKHTDPSDSVKDYVSEKSERLKKYFQGKIHVTWNFSKEHGEFIAHCHLVGNSMDYFGESSSNDIYASIDLAMSKLEKQIKKHKEIVTNHHHPKDKATS